MQIFKRLLTLLTIGERKSTIFLLGMILIMALIDMLGVASILPFMAVLTNPNIIETNNFLNSMFEASKIFGIENNQEFLFVLGLLVFLLLITSLSVRAITTYVQLRFIQMLEYSMTKRLIESYLHQPYSWFLSRHSADIGKNILSEVAGVIGSGIKPIIEIIAKSMVAIALITLLFLVNPKLALLIILLLGGTYMLVFYFIRSYLRKIGEKRLANNELRFKSVIEAFGAAKEVKVGGLEQTYVERFSEPSYIFAKTQASSGVIAQLPRYILEAISFGGVLLIILYMMAQSGNFGTALPILSLYVFAGYRLMPALQQIYSSFTQLAFISPSIEKLHEDIKSLKPFNRNQDQSALSFNKSITLKNVHYNYPNASRSALKDINLTIPIKSTVGLVGATGSGKTTTVDIILGLLEAQKGTLEIDGKIITQQNKRSWQKAIGYVPQHIYLTDDTISANIAFGVEIEDINQEAVEKASKIANLHEFIIDELPKKYQTTIGERGVRLSGGQRQRIGIARALYHNPQVLILDEATSALDNQTEKAVMDAVNNLNKDRTIILIAHRLGTVKNCDTIFLLNKGQLQHKGTFEELINVSENFRINAEN
ncbi:ABC transporter ATP-binding protein/permease [Candidatus Pelagibacter bacterium]|nr:ABC transporter ATP-binding protein [Candidatus Pelagibacter bacterium]MDA8846075.1 ABC transporter ATP-binding protein/permease [Candidatus Pelagibacter bacterium]